MKEAKKQKKFVTPKVLDWWRFYCRACRSKKAAYFMMITEYRRGIRIGDVGWKQVWKSSPALSQIPITKFPLPYMPIPEGWSYANFLRHTKNARLRRAGVRLPA